MRPGHGAPGAGKDAQTRCCSRGPSKWTTAIASTLWGRESITLEGTRRMTQGGFLQVSGLHPGGGTCLFC